MDTGLRDQVVLVTGASGGIGGATARAFAAGRARVVLHYHRGRKRAESLARDPGMERAWVAGADSRSEREVRGLISGIVRRFGRLDVLVANAGAWEARDRGVQEMSLRQWNATLEAVLTSTFLCVREFFRHVARRKEGNVVFGGVHGRRVRGSRSRGLCGSEGGHGVRVDADTEERDCPAGADDGGVLRGAGELRVSRLDGGPAQRGEAGCGRWWDG